MATIGLCEDDALIARVIEEALRSAGHEVVRTATGADAFERFSPIGSINVAVLDISLPDADGRDVCQSLRVAGQTAPVLFLTAREGLHDKVAGFHSGGDDYLTKPFAIPELLVRVEALARRQPAPSATSGLVLDARRFSLRFADDEVALTPTEFRMLAALAARPGDVVRRREVVAAGWPMGAIVQENTIDSYIRRLRTKLEAVHADVGIETVRGVGYALR